VIALREYPLPESLAFCDTPDRAAEYWRLHVQTNQVWRHCSLLRQGIRWAAGRD
jgi:hypothetical protein